MQACSLKIRIASLKQLRCRFGFRIGKRPLRATDPS